MESRAEALPRTERVKRCGYLLWRLAHEAEREGPLAHEAEREGSAGGWQREGERGVAAEYLDEVAVRNFHTNLEL